MRRKRPFAGKLKRLMTTTSSPPLNPEERAALIQELRERDATAEERKKIVGNLSHLMDNRGFRPYFYEDD